MLRLCLLPIVEQDKLLRFVPVGEASCFVRLGCNAAPFVGCFMVRLASLFAFACLTLAASAFLAAPKTIKKEQDEERNLDLSNRLIKSASSDPVSFHARFSLN